MQRPVARAALVLALMSGSIEPSGAAGQGRVEIPIRQTTISDGTVRYSVPVSIGGGAPIDAMLDTGSFGLRVLASALRPDQYTSTRTERRYPYGSGAVLRGPIASASVALGSASTEAPIGIQVVTSVGCASDRPHCPVSKIPASQYGIGGDGFAGEGFKAILGVSLRRAPAATGANNPLADIADSSWIINLPRPGEAAPGDLILDPAPDEAAGFVAFQLQPQTGETGDGSGWMDARLPGCLKEGEAEPVCAPTLLDSGAPGVVIMTEDVSPSSSTGAGVPASLSFSEGASDVSAGFVTGSDPATTIKREPPRQFGPRIMAGSVPFYTLSVLYDAKHGTIALKRRSDTAR